MKIKIILIFIFLSNVVAGQSETPKTYKNQVKLSPVRLITVIRAVQVSYERHYSKNLSTQLTAGYIIDLLPYHYLDLKNMSGFILGLEQKRFFHKTEIVRPYLAMSADMLTCSVNTVAEFSYEPVNDLPVFYSDTINIRRNTYSFAFKYGMQFYIKHLVVDLNVGLGLRYRDVTHTDKLYENGVWWKRMEPSVPDELFINGKYFTFNIPLGLKIGYAF